MTQAPTGRDREWNRVNVLRWMRTHGRGVGDARQLAELAALAFGVDVMFAAFEPGEHWAYELAGAVVMEGAHAAA
jgi:hypothetical protein